MYRAAHLRDWARAALREEKVMPETIIRHRWRAVCGCADVGAQTPWSAAHPCCGMCHSLLCQGHAAFAQSCPL